MEIQDAAGKPLVSEKRSFEQKVFPFQGFQGGLEETVVKPYTPLKTTARTLKPSAIKSNSAMPASWLPFAAGFRARCTRGRRRGAISWLRR